jgi:hypothetical protein
MRSWRRRATYTRRGGIGYCFGAYDVHADLLFGGYRLAKTASEVLAFYCSIRRGYPAELRVYLVNDNLSLHWTPVIRAWAAGAQRGVGADTNLGQLSESHRVPLPTTARIRAECLGLRQSCRGGTGVSTLPPPPQHRPSLQPHPPA